MEEYGDSMVSHDTDGWKSSVYPAIRWAIESEPIAIPLNVVGDEAVGQGAVEEGEVKKYDYKVWSHRRGSGVDA